MSPTSTRVLLQADPVTPGSLFLSLSGLRLFSVRAWALGCLLQRPQQASLSQVSFQRVVDVQLLVGSQGEQLLDHFSRVWTSAERPEGKRYTPCAVRQLQGLEIFIIFNLRLQPTLVTHLGFNVQSNHYIRNSECFSA